MYRSLAFTFLLLISSFCNADDGTIDLSCSLSIKNYPSLPSTLLFKDITLKGQKHTATGSAKVFAISNYEFWVMNHAIQTLNEKNLVLNFQVAIKNLETKEFFHALSNGAHTEDIMAAQIGLVAYVNDRLWESGELIFKCMKEAP